MATGWRYPVGRRGDRVGPHRWVAAHGDIGLLTAPGRAVKHEDKTSRVPPGCVESTRIAWINVQSTSLTVTLEGSLVGRNEGPVAFAGNGEADDVAAAVVVLDESPDNDGARAFGGLHLRTVQGGCDLKDLHRRHSKPGDPGLERADQHGSCRSEARPRRRESTPKVVSDPPGAGTSSTSGPQVPTSKLQTLRPAAASDRPGPRWMTSVAAVNGARSAPYGVSRVGSTTTTGYTSQRAALGDRHETPDRDVGQ